MNQSNDTYKRKESGSPKQQPVETISSVLNKVTNFCSLRSSTLTTTTTNVALASSFRKEPLASHWKLVSEANFNKFQLVNCKPSLKSSVGMVRAQSTEKVESKQTTTYKERRNAMRILRRHLTQPVKESEVSAEEFQLISKAVEMAKAILPNFRLDYVPPERAHILKRKLPLGGSHRSAPKMVKPIPTKEKQTQKTFAQIAKDRIIIGVIDRANENGEIPRHQWGWVQAALAKIALQVVRENPGCYPSCIEAGWYQGSIKLIACDDMQTVKLYKSAITKVGNVYPGAQLDIVAARDIPSRPCAKACIPAMPDTTEEILEMIREFNPNIPTENWAIGNLGEARRAMRQVIIILNKESLEPLAKCNGFIKYGFSNVKLRDYKPNTEEIGDYASFVTEEYSSESELESELFPQPFGFMYSQKMSSFDEVAASGTISQGNSCI